MKQIQWPFLILAFAAVACMMGTGVAISYGSTLGIIGTLLAFVLIMGLGFKTKKKMREAGKI